MDQYESRLKEYIENNEIKAEHLHFEQSCHSVEDAAKAVDNLFGKGVDQKEFVKNICLVDAEGNLIVAIVKGEYRVDIKRVSELVGKKIKIATPEEILEKTGYPCGGTPSFGYQATFLIDERVFEKEVVYSGGGSQNSLVKISPLEMQKTNKGKIVKIRK